MSTSIVQKNLLIFFLNRRFFRQSVTFWARNRVSRYHYFETPLTKLSFRSMKPQQLVMSIIPSKQTTTGETPFAEAISGSAF